MVVKEKAAPHDVCFPRSSSAPQAAAPSRAIDNAAFVPRACRAAPATSTGVGREHFAVSASESRSRAHNLLPHGRRRQTPARHARPRYHERGSVARTQLSNLADMSKSDCTRAIDLAAVRRRCARPPRLRMTDEDYGLVALAMAQHTANLPSWDAPPPPQPAPQVPEPQPSRRRPRAAPAANSWHRPRQSPAPLDWWAWREPRVRASVRDVGNNSVAV